MSSQPLIWHLTHSTMRIPNRSFKSQYTTDNSNECRPVPAYLQLLSNQNYIYSHDIATLNHDICTKGYPLYDVYLSFSMLQSIKLPAPYDTDCLEYPKTPYQSSYHCFDECLKRLFEPLNLVPMFTVVDRHRYSNSSYYFVSLAMLEEGDFESIRLSNPLLARNITVAQQK